MNGFDDNYYMMQNIKYVVLKFLIALSGKYFKKKKIRKISKLAKF